MPASDFKRLLDALARHQFYLEGLKAGYTQDFIDVSEALRRDIRDEFRMLEVDDMSTMTQRQLDAFIRRLSALQARHYSIYTKKLIDDLRDFMDADLDTHAAVLRDTQVDKKALALLAALIARKRRGGLWITILQSPIPANGQLTAAMIERLRETTAFNIDTAVRRAWANKATVREALGTIVGTKRLRYRDSVLSRSIPQADAMLATIVQHIASIVQSNALAQFYDEYIWVSVLDNKTSDICIARDGKIYAYGKGPLPPAHWRCRSHIEPYTRGEQNTTDVTFTDWLDSQPVDVRADMRGGPKPLTLRQFAAKLGLLLAS